MALTIEVPLPIAQEFDETARQDGPPSEDQAAVLLFIADALHGSGKQTTEFQKAVQAYLAARSIDPSHLSHVVNELMALCFTGQTDASEFPHSLNGNLDKSIVDRLLNWRLTSVRTQPSPVSEMAQSENLSREPMSEDDPAADAFMDAAWEIYNERLKSILEPEFLGQVVAIHPASGDYEVARNSAKAARLLRQRHPGELVAMLDIGIVSEHNPLSLRASGLLRRAKA